jgi:hypothetical protein
MHEPHEYTAIYAWCQHLGSFGFYLTQQQRKAALEDAPLDAIFRRTDGGWATTDDIVDPITRATVRRLISAEAQHQAGKRLYSGNNQIHPDRIGWDGEDSK